MYKRKIAQAFFAYLLFNSQGEVFARLAEQEDILIVGIEKNAAPEKQRQKLEQLLLAGKIVVVQGSTEELEILRPQWAELWPKTDSIVLSMRAGMGIYGVSNLRNASKSTIRDFVLNEIRWPSLASLATEDGTIAAKAEPISEVVSQTIRPSGPASACVDFNNTVYKALFKGTTPTDEQRAAVAKEAARWCQYGGLLTSNPSGFAVPDYEFSLIPRKAIDFEWALIRDQDLLSPDRSTMLFWTKSKGEGSGLGFTRHQQDTAFWSDNIVRNLFDVGIHSGWGVQTVHDRNSWAQTSPGEYWPSYDHNFFECDKSIRAPYYPTGIELVRVFPEDTFDNTVTTAAWTALTIGGTVTLTPGVGPTGPTFAAAFALNVAYTTTNTVTAAVSLTTIQTNATPTYSRSTRWRPNIAGVWDWIKATRIPDGGRIGNATPLAATLSPKYDILWKMPIRGNEKRPLRYAVISEAGVNHCVRTACVSQNPPDKSIPPQQRIVWSDEVEIQF